MDIAELKEIFNIEDLNDLPIAIMNKLCGDIQQRDQLYKRLLIVNKYDLSFDWFQGIYETEFSERKQKKQDFTPHSVGVLASKLTGLPKGMICEPTAGNGSMIIADWWNRCQSVVPWEMFPSENLVSCWELSNRSVPILLLNLSIRGIMGYVYHGDVIEKDVRQKYILLNRKNDAFAFSEIIKVDGNSELFELPHTKYLEDLKDSAKQPENQLKLFSA